MTLALLYRQQNLGKGFSVGPAAPTQNYNLINMLFASASQAAYAYNEIPYNLSGYPGWSFSNLTGGYSLDGSTRFGVNLLPNSNDVLSAYWGNGGLSSISANAGTDPFGDNKANAIAWNAGTGAGNAYVFVPNLLSPGTPVMAASTTYTLSMWVRGTGVFWLNWYDNTTNLNGNSGAITATSSWVRYSYTFTTASGITVSTTDVGLNSADGNAGSLYIYGAQLGLGSTATPYARTTTAATSAPRITSAGLLVEGSATNLATYSTSLTTNLPWNNDISLSIASAAVVAPDGTTSGVIAATPISSLGVPHMYYQSITGTASAPYTFSYFAKANGDNFVGLVMSDYNDNNGGYAIVNLSTGLVAFTGTFGSGTLLGATCSSVRNGWYRVSISAIASTATSLYPSIWVGPTQAAVQFAMVGGQFAGDGVSGAYIWGPQVEAGSVATSYIPTGSSTASRAADVASLTYSGTASSMSVTTPNLGTLSYPITGVTNLCWPSNDHSHSNWTHNGSSITAFNILAPDGTYSAQQQTEDTSNGAHNDFYTLSTTANQVICFSRYIKPVSRRYCFIGITNGSDYVDVIFDLTGTGAQTFQAVSGSGIYVGSGITALANGWYRVWVAGSLSDTTYYPYCGCSIYATNPGRINTSYTGTNGYWYQWQSQIEAGSAPSSLVPTTTGAQTYPQFGVITLDAPTNLLPQSTPTGANGWFAYNTATATGGYADPLGGTTGVQVALSPSAAWEYGNLALAAGVTYTISAYIRCASGTQVVCLDLFDGYTYTDHNSSDLIVTTSWQRLSVSYTPASSTPYGGFCLVPGSANAAATVIFAFPQLEANPFPTGYVPTSGTAATGPSMPWLGQPITSLTVQEAFGAQMPAATGSQVSTTTPTFIAGSGGTVYSRTFTATANQTSIILKAIGTHLLNNASAPATVLKGTSKAIPYSAAQTSILNASKTFFRTLTAIGSQISSFTKNFGHVVVATASQTSKVANAISKQVPYNFSQVSTVIKQYATIYKATGSQVSSVNTIKSRLITLTAIGSQISVLRNAISKTIPYSVNMTKNLQNSITKFVPYSLAQTSKVVNAISKSIPYSVAQVSIVNLIKSRFVTLTATGSQISVMVKQFGHVFPYSVNTTKNLTNGIAKFITNSATQVSTSTPIKVHIQNLLATGSQVSTILKPVGKLLVATASSTKNLTNAISKFVPYSANTAKNLQNAITKKVPAATASQVSTIVTSKTFYRTLTATGNQISTFVKVFGKNLVATGSQISSLRNAISKFVPYSVTQASNAYKQWIHTFTSNATQVSSITTIKLKVQNLFATGSQISTLRNSITKLIPYSVGSAKTLTNGITKFVTNSVTQVSTVRKSTTKTLVATGSQVSVLNQSRTYSRLLAATASQVSTLSNVISKVVGYAAAQTSTVTKQYAHIFTKTATQISTLIAGHQYIRLLTATASQVSVSTAKRAISQVAYATANQVSTLTRNYGRFLYVLNSPIASVCNSITKTITGQATQTSTLSKAFVHTYVATASQVSSLFKVFGKTLIATASQTSKVQKQLAHTYYLFVSQVSTLQKGITKAIPYNVTQVSTVIKGQQKLLPYSVTQISTTARGFGKTLVAIANQVSLVRNNTQKLVYQ